MQSESPEIFYQFFEAESSTYTYLIGDPGSKLCALIDPVLETVDRDLKWIEELGLKLKYVLDTHVHADHITGAGEIRNRTGAQSGVAATAGVDCADLSLKDGDELRLGEQTLRVLATPGHTHSCLSYLWIRPPVFGKQPCDRAFTGDALLIRGTGRTDFQQGSSEELYRSIHEKLFTLKHDTEVYPAHDYRGQMRSLIGLEKRYNPRVGGGTTIEQFCLMMRELKLAQPKKIHEALAANVICGRRTAVLSAQIVDGILELSPQTVWENRQSLRLIDVRRPDEFSGELHHVPGATLKTLGPELESWLQSASRDEATVFICRSGGRSGQATRLAKQMGFSKIYNMTGGMLAWNQQKLDVE